MQQRTSTSDLLHSDKPTIPILTMKFAIIPILSILALYPILAIGSPLPANALMKREDMNVESREVQCTSANAACMKAVSSRFKRPFRRHVE